MTNQTALNRGNKQRDRAVPHWFQSPELEPRDSAVKKEGGNRGKHKHTQSGTHLSVEAADDGATKTKMDTKIYIGNIAIITDRTQ